MSGHGGSSYTPDLYRPLRPIPSESGSEQTEGRFGRMFALGQTIDDGEILSPHPSPVSDLRKLGEAKINGQPGPMVDEADAQGDSTTPAGFTFLGQFIDHDITLDTTSSLDRPAMPDQIENARNPGLDLDCVYGGGRDATPFLYQHSNTKYPSDAGPLDAQIRGPRMAEGPKLKGKRCDLLRVKTHGDDGGTALIGDPRNDENVIVSQIQFAFIRFHNQLCDNYMKAKGLDVKKLSPRQAKEIYDKVRDHVIHYYHKVILEDFLPGLIGLDLVFDIAEKGRRYYFKNGFIDHKGGCILRPYMPVEFSVAAYRFGHSQVRQKYLLHPAEGPVDLFDDKTGGLRGFKPIDPKNVIDWRLLFDFSSRSDVPAAGKPVQMARKIDVKLAKHLFALHTAGVVDRDDLGSLAARNLNRGRSFRLPSGQDLARLMGLPQEQIIEEDPAARAIIGVKDLPLWYYVLAEAGKFGAGNKLGPVGGRIVGEVLLGLLDHYRERNGGKGLDLIVDPALRLGGEPTAFGERFTFSSLLYHAGISHDV